MGWEKFAGIRTQRHSVDCVNCCTFSIALRCRDVLFNGTLQDNVTPGALPLPLPEWGRGREGGKRQIHIDILNFIFVCVCVCVLLIMKKKKDKLKISVVYSLSTA